MSLRTFTVFQDTPSSEVPQPKVSRPNAMVTRSQRATSNIVSAGDIPPSENLAIINKENYNPLTGERAGPSSNGLKKRKTTVLATKVQAETASKPKKKGLAQSESDLQPEPKKRKASTAVASKPKVSSTTTKKDTVKGSSSVKKPATKRTGLKKAATMPKLAEEDESRDKERVLQVDADTRCYELTVKPLADVSQAYEEVDVFESFTACATGSTSTTNNVSEGNIKFSTIKECSVEPELRDYFQPPRGSYPSNGARVLRALSEDPAPRPFSTPERRQIYSAFTFSSPSATTTRLNSSKATSNTMSPVEEAL